MTPRMRPSNSEVVLRLPGDAVSSLVLDEEPVNDDDGCLVLSGHCPTQPAKTHFTLRYYFEQPTWKLLHIRVRTGD